MPDDEEDVSCRCKCGSCGAPSLVAFSGKRQWSELINTGCKGRKKITKFDVGPQSMRPEAGIHLLFFNSCTLCTSPFWLVRAFASCCAPCCHITGMLLVNHHFTHLFHKCFPICSRLLQGHVDARSSVDANLSANLCGQQYFWQCWLEHNLMPYCVDSTTVCKSCILCTTTSRLTHEECWMV